MTSRQPILEDYGQVGLLRRLWSGGIIAQTLGLDMFERYLTDITEIHGGHALRYRMQAGPSPGMETECITIEGFESNPVILDVIPRRDRRGQIFSQDLGKAKDKLGLKLKFELPTFFFSSSSEIGINIMDVAAGVKWSKLRDEMDTKMNIFFKSSKVTFYFFISDREGQFTLDIRSKRMKLGTLVDKLVLRYFMALDEIAASDDSGVDDELMKHLPKTKKSMAHMFLLGILPVSATACVLLLQWPADIPDEERSSL